MCLASCVVREKATRQRSRFEVLGVGGNFWPLSRGDDREVAKHYYNTIREVAMGSYADERANGVERQNM
eukprot:1358848-Lingulodinium_polyedra.AAC.1